MSQENLSFRPLSLFGPGNSLGYLIKSMLEAEYFFKISKSSDLWWWACMRSDQFNICVPASENKSLEDK